MLVFNQFALTVVIALFVALLVAAVEHHRQMANAGFAGTVGISRHITDRIFLGLATSYALIFGTLSLLRHQSFHTGGFDLGIFDQVIWNSLNGRLFENSIMIDSPSFLGHHFSPILLALVPLYSIWDDPRMLLATQTLALTVAGFPLYWFARRKLGALLALVIAAGYFLSPPLQSVNLADFHEISLAVLFLSFALYFMLNQRDVPFLICLGLALISKEEVSFIVFGFGLFVLLVQRKRALGLSLCVLGLGWAAMTLLYLIPFFHGPAFTTDYYFVGRYAYLGKSVFEVARNALLQPGLVLEHLVIPLKIEFVLHLLVPLLFIPFLGTEVFALSLPSFAYLLLGDDPFQDSIRSQYTAPLIPFIYFAAVLGVKRITQYSASSLTMHFSKVALAVGIGAASILNYYFQSAGPLGLYFDSVQYSTTTHTQLGYQLLKDLPPNASLYSDSNYVPHLSQRPTIYQASIEFIPDLHKVDYLFADQTLSVHRDFSVFWDDVLASPMYETILEQDGYLIKKREAPKIAFPTQIQFDHRIALLGYSLESGESARRGDNARLILTWRADQNIRVRYVTFVHLVDSQNHIWAQDDREPANGWLRTDRWNAGDITTDRFTLELPATMPPGEYRITTGFYAVTDQINLTATDPSGQSLGSEPGLGVMKISAP